MRKRKETQPAKSEDRMNGKSASKLAWILVSAMIGFLLGRSTAGRPMNRRVNLPSYSPAAAKFGDSDSGDNVNKVGQPLPGEPSSDEPRQEKFLQDPSRRANTTRPPTSAELPNPYEPKSGPQSPARVPHKGTGMATTPAGRV